MPLLKIIPSYLYWQYQDDDDLQSFVTAYNGLAQEYLNSFNSLNMPIYTIQEGALLDWLATGIYGYPRPVIATVGNLLKGPYNTIDYNSETIPYNELTSTGSGGGYRLTDDEYKRFLTWNFYKGDGFYFNISWLKRRVKRFLQGFNGSAPDIQETYEISVTFPALYECKIEIIGALKSNYGTLLENGIKAGVLYLPFQWKYDVVMS